MTAQKKHMAAALTLSTLLIIFNIIAVTQSTAVDYYSQLEQFISSLLPTL